MYAPADKGKDLTVLCPMKTDNGVFDDCAAWAFTAPTAGIYEFAHSPDEDSAAYAETQFFMVRGGSHKVGVRIKMCIRDRSKPPQRSGDRWAGRC